jgi:hypothetical protein
MASKPGDALNRLCAGAQDLIIAVPYIKADALTIALSHLNLEASLTCVTRWNPQDIAAGASDTECRTIVLQRGGSFRLHPSLHAKYYRAGDSVLIGSANLTSPAMGWSLQSNLEILCRPGSDFDPLEFEQELLQHTREISDDEFARWDSITSINVRSQLPITPDTQPPLDNWRPVTRDPRHLEFTYQGQQDRIASFDEQQAAQRDIQALLIPHGLTAGQLRIWLSACLLAAPFTNAVIRSRPLDTPTASRTLATAYGLSITQARRDMETVQNWLAFLAPETTRNRA